MELTLNRDIGDLGIGTSSRTLFIEVFKADVAAAAECEQARISVQNIRAGSIVVQFAIAVVSDSTQPSVATTVATLTAWLEESNRTLGGAGVLSPLTVNQAAPDEQQKTWEEDTTDTLT